VNREYEPPQICSHYAVHRPGATFNVESARFSLIGRLTGGSARSATVHKLSVANARPTSDEVAILPTPLPKIESSQRLRDTGVPRPLLTVRMW